MYSLFKLIYNFVSTLVCEDSPIDIPSEAETSIPELNNEHPNGEVDKKNINYKDILIKTGICCIIVITIYYFGFSSGSNDLISQTANAVIYNGVEHYIKVQDAFSSYILELTEAGNAKRAHFLLTRYFYFARYLSNELEKREMTLEEVLNDLKNWVENFGKGG